MFSVSVAATVLVFSFPTNLVYSILHVLLSHCFCLQVFEWKMAQTGLKDGVILQVIEGCFPTSTLT